MTSELTVVFKPTRDCNLRCKYCSVGDPASLYLSKEDAEIIVKKIIKRKSVSKTKFIWHGGEPLLAGLSFYEHIVRIQEPLKKKGARIVNVVQTNGTLINDDWAEFFKKNNFGVGLSIDGPEEINNLTRVFSKNIGAFGRIEKGSEILKTHGVNHGYLVVVSRYNVERIDEIIDFMKKEKKTFKLVAVSPIGRAADAKSKVMMEGNNFSTSQLKLFERWLKEGDDVLRSALWKYIVPILTRVPIECIFSKNCQEYYLGVDCNGDTYPCGRFCGSEKFLFGNLLNHSFEEVWQHPRRLKLLKRPEKLKKCHKCRYFNICNGGCPMQALCGNGSIYREDYNCDQYYKIFSEIERTIKHESGLRH